MREHRTRRRFVPTVEACGNRLAPSGGIADVPEPDPIDPPPDFPPFDPPIPPGGPSTPK